MKIYILIVIVILTILIFLFKNKIIFLPSKTINYNTIILGNKYSIKNIKRSQLSNTNYHLELYFFEKGDFINEEHKKIEETDTIILFSYGNGGNVSYYLDTINILQNYGDVMTYDYPGYGLSTGTPSEENLNSSGIDVFNHLEKLDRYKNIILYGFSMGGAVTINILSKNINSKNIKGVILQSTFAKIEDCVFILGNLCAKNMFRSIDKISSIQHTKICIMHSPGDGVVPFLSSKNLYDKILSPKLFITLNYKKGHNDPISKDVIDEAMKFIIK